MARERVVQQVATPKQSTPPTAREVRAQTVHRLQIGLFGLCAMLLLVGLANIIMDRARLADDSDPAAALSAPEVSTNSATDPLADIGVVPAADPSASVGKGKGK